MIYTFVQLKREEFERYWTGLATCKLAPHQAQSVQILQPDNPNHVGIVFRWLNTNAMQSFLQSAHVQAARQRGGMLGQPVITVR